MGCCSVRSVGVTVGLLSLIMSSQLLLPTVLSLVETESTNTTTTTLLYTSLSWLRSIPSHYEMDNTTRQDMDLFIEGLISNLDNSSVFTLALSCLNIVTAFFMMVGSCCSLSCLMLPWLILAMVEILTIAVPATIFFSLVGVYLYFKGLFMVSIIVMAVPASLLLLNFVLWLTVLVAYSRDEAKEDCQVLEDTEEEEEEVQETEPLIGGVQGPPQPSYNLGHYPQYYPAHHNPSAPPPSQSPGGGPAVYPSLATQ